MDKIKNKILEAYLGLYFLITLIATNIFLIRTLKHFNIKLDFIIFVITIASHALLISKTNLLSKDK